MKCKKCHKEIENLEVCPYCKCKQIKDKVIKDAKRRINIAEKELNKLPILNDSRFITYILMGILVLKLILGSVVTNMSFIGYLLRNIVTILLFIYFLLIHVDIGKKKFSYLNGIVCILLFIQGIIPIFSLFVTFKFYKLFSCFSNFLLALYFIRNFLGEYVEDFPLLDAFDNKEYFYTIIGISALSLVLEIPTFINSGIWIIILDLLSFIFTCCMARYIYLYKKDSKGLFREIKKSQEKLSKEDIDNKTKSVLKKYNGYQLFGFFILILGLVMGIYLGSESAVCTEVSVDCSMSSFNFSIMFLISGISIFLCVLLFWMGQVLKILEEIAKREGNPIKNMKKSVKNID